MESAQAHQLRDDIADLESMITTLLEHRADRQILGACFEILRKKRDRLAELEPATGADAEK